MPCWVQTLQPDPDAARGFYKALLGWEFGADGSVAQVRGRDVAGIDMLPAGGVPAWITYIRSRTPTRPHTDDELAAHARSRWRAAVLRRRCSGGNVEPIAPGVSAARLGGYAGETGQPLPTDTVALIAPTAEGVPPHWNVNLRVEDAGEPATRPLRPVLSPPAPPRPPSLVIADPQGRCSRYRRVK